jgi:hypothetical protein
VLIVPVLLAVLAVLLSMSILALILHPLHLISLGCNKIRCLVFGTPTPSFPQLEPPEMDSNRRAAECSTGGINAFDQGRIFMTRPKRWQLWMTMLALFVGIFVVPSVVLLGIKDRGAITQEACDRIKAGMTKEEVTRILGGRIPFTMTSGIGSDSWIYESDDGSTLLVPYFKDAVSSRPVFQESGETQWDRMKRKARMAYDRMVSLF